MPHSDLLEKQVSEPLLEKDSSLQSYLIEKQVIALVDMPAKPLVSDTPLISITADYASLEDPPQPKED